MNPTPHSPIRFACLLSHVVVATTLLLVASVRADAPISAYNICNNVGIVGRFGAESGDAYRANLAPLAAAIADAGCHHMRSAVAAGFEADVLTVLNGNGRNILLCAMTREVDGTNHLDSSTAGVAAALNRLQTIRDAGRLRYIEGPNEWNHEGPSDWAPDLADFQRKLFAAARLGSNNQVNGSYAGYTVVQAPVAGGGTGTDFQTYADELAKISGSKANWGSGHIYGGSATSFETRFENNLDRLQAIPPGDPFVLTETGLSTTAGVGLTINEEVKGKYLARLFMDVAQRWPLTIQSAYYFELYEAATNSGAATTMGLIERDTLVRKRGFFVFRNMLWLLGSPDTTSLPALSVSLAGSTVGQVERQLVRRSDGVYLLFLWQDKALWDTATDQPVADADGTVDVTLGGITNRLVRIYRPAGAGWGNSGSGSALNDPTDQRNTSATGVLANVPINGGMTVLEFKSSGTLPAVRESAPTWTPGL